MLFIYCRIGSASYISLPSSLPPFIRNTGPNQDNDDGPGGEACSYDSAGRFSKDEASVEISSVSETMAFLLQYGIQHSQECHGTTSPYVHMRYHRSMAHLFVVPVMQVTKKHLEEEKCDNENADDLMVGIDRHILDANDTEYNSENKSEDAQHCRDGLTDPVKFE